MTDVSLSTTSAVTPQAGDLIPVVRNGAWVNADGAVLVDAASSATAAANSATSATQEVEQSLTTISSGVSSAQETADAALRAVQSGGFVTETSLETTLGGYATTSGVTSEIESATSGFVSSGTSGTNIGANPVTYGGQTVSLNTALEQASQTGGDGSGSSELTPGMIVQPTAIESNVALTNQMASATIGQFGPAQARPGSEIVIDPSTEYQEWIGVGGALTSSSCYCFMTYLTKEARTALFQKMFGTGGFECLRICFGASDYAIEYYTYCDDWDGVDTSLPTFTIAKDMDYVIPCLLEILEINPRIWIFASIWSPPPAMKSSGVMNGGTFNATVTNYTALANYIVKAIQAYAALGIQVSAVTPQNEPQGSHDYPSCQWTGATLTSFVATYLGPAIFNAGLTTEIIACDTSWGSAPSYGLGILSDQYASQFCKSVGYHGYNGYVAQVPAEVRPYPGTRVFFTEWISEFSDAQWYIAEKFCATLFNNMIRYGARGIMLWNLALDQTGAPWQTEINASWPCRGVVTINNTTGAITYNSDYLIFASMAKVAKRGAKLIKSNSFTMNCADKWTATATSAGTVDTDVTNVAFKNLDGSIAVFMWNPLSVSRTVTLTDGSTGMSNPVTIAAQTWMAITWSAAGEVTDAATFTAPSAPTLGTPTIDTDGKPIIAITAPTTIGSSDLGGYAIYEGTATGGEGTLPKYVLPGDATSFKASLLAAGSTAFWTAQAFGIGGYSPSSNEVSATATNPAATGYALAGSASLVEGTATTFTITPNGAIGSTAVVITPASTVAGTFNPTTVTLAAGSAAAVTFTFTPSAAGTGTLSTTNNGSLTDPAALSITAAAAAADPTKYTVAPASSSIVAGGSTGVTFTLDQPATSSVVITPGDGGAGGTWSAATLTIAVGATSGTLTYTAGSTAGSVTLTGTNTLGLTAGTATLTVTASATAPGAPTVSLTAGNGQVSVNVLAPSSNGGATITGYPIYAGTTSGQANQTLLTTLTAPGSYTITGLTNGTAEYVNVGATNSVGTTYATEASATPVEAAAVTYLAAPSTGVGATTTGTVKALTGSVVEMFVDCDLDSYTNTTTASYLAGNTPVTGATWQNAQFALIIDLNGTTTLRYYDSNKAYCYSTATLPTGLSGRVTFHAIANISTTATYTDKLGNVISAEGIVIHLSQDDGATYTTLTSTAGSASKYGSIIPLTTQLSQMSVGHLAENAGKIYSATVYDDTGTAIWSPDFTTQTAGATTFTDAESNAWAVESGASITSG